jgi:hypothetical protein
VWNRKGIDADLFAKSQRSLLKEIFQKSDWRLARKTTMCCSSSYPPYLAWCLAHPRGSRAMCWNILLLKPKGDRLGYRVKVLCSCSLGKPQRQKKKSMNRVKKSSFKCIDNDYTMDCFRDIKAIQGLSLDLLRSSLGKAITVQLSQNASSFHQQGPNSKLYKSCTDLTLPECLSVMSFPALHTVGYKPWWSPGRILLCFPPQKEKS